jgi:hypothetical protein
MLSRSKIQILPMNDCFGSSVLTRGEVAVLENGANRSRPRAKAKRNREEEEKDPECDGMDMDVMTAHQKVPPERSSGTAAIMAGLWFLSAVSVTGA